MQSLRCHSALARTISALSSCRRSRCVLPNTALHELILVGYSSVSPVVMLVRDSSKLDCRHSLRYSSVMLVR